MQRFSFKKGLVFVELNTRRQLIRRLVTGLLQFESDIGEVKSLTDKEVLNLWMSGQWRVDEATLGLSGDAIYLVTPADLSTFPLKWQEIAKRRLHYINAVAPDVNKYNLDLWNEWVKNGFAPIKQYQHYSLG